MDLLGPATYRLAYATNQDLQAYQRFEGLPGVLLFCNVFDVCSAFFEYIFRCAQVFVDFCKRSYDFPLSGLVFLPSFPAPRPLSLA